MSEKRRDNKGRILHNGEMQMPDGRYRFKYTDTFGKEKAVYSWRLTSKDPIIPNKRCKVSLREMEKQIQADQFDNIVSSGGNLTVLELTEKYIQTRTGVRPTTMKGYGTVINLLKREPIGSKRIDTVRLSDAKHWLIELQQKQKKSYSAIHNIRGVLRPAFQLAVDDDLIRKNPFEFKLVDVIVNDSVRREAIRPDEERKFLEFVKNDKHFSRYYEGVYILFKTGMRISEFCGLTISDINFKNHTISITRQLLKNGAKGYYIQATKTSSGTRVIPMTSDVEECFKRILEKRKSFKIEPMIDGISGFLYFDMYGSISYSLHWEHYFNHMVQKYNSIYIVQMPKITPHVCRHTYCSNMARKGMNPKTLQYLMGHSDISVTLNTYTHLGLDDAEDEIQRLGLNDAKDEIQRLRVV
nr:site-specific integrase [uncultured Mediterraneibacter sp.]